MIFFFSRKTLLCLLHLVTFEHVFILSSFFSTNMGNISFYEKNGWQGFFFLHFALSCLLLFQGHYLPSVKKILFIYLFIYFWLCWVFSAGHRLSLVAENNPSLQCTGFTLWYVCYCGAQAQVYGLSSCGGT